MLIEIKTLTPIWTGGIDAGKMDRIREIGIIGSLRWWYEALVRALGGEVCGPSKPNCPNSNNKMCDVCIVFGATGLRRRFRLEIAEDETQPAWKRDEKMLNIRPPGRTRGWYLPPGRVGSFKLSLHGDPQVLSLLASLFLFLEKWGNLGAKPQLGYGVFSILNRETVIEYARKWEWRTLNSAQSTRNSSDRLPDLRHFGFFRFNFQPESPTWWTRIAGMERVATSVQPLVVNHQTVPLAPALKNDWRFNCWQGRVEDEREVFGALRPDRYRSKVAVSWAYPKNDGWEVRGWAWLPFMDKKLPIANQVWNDILQDEQSWQRVLGMHGTLTSEPGKRWSPKTSEESVKFLEKSRND